MGKFARAWGWSFRVVRLLAAITFLGSLALILLHLGWNGPAGPPVQLRLDINHAPEPVLTALPGIGPTRARAIVAARQSHPIESPVDLELRVRGIGPRTTNALRPFLRFPKEQPRDGD